MWPATPAMASAAVNWGWTNGTPPPPPEDATAKLSAPVFELSVTEMPDWLPALRAAAIFTTNRASARASTSDGDRNDSFETSVLTSALMSGAATPFTSRPSAADLASALAMGVATAVARLSMWESGTAALAMAVTAVAVGASLAWNTASPPYVSFVPSSASPLAAASPDRSTRTRLFAAMWAKLAWWPLSPRRPLTDVLMTHSPPAYTWYSPMFSPAAT